MGRETVLTPCNLKVTTNSSSLPMPPPPPSNPPAPTRTRRWESFVTFVLGDVDRWISAPNPEDAADPSDSEGDDDCGCDGVGRAKEKGYVHINDHIDEREEANGQRQVVGESAAEHPSTDASPADDHAHDNSSLLAHRYRPYRDGFTSVRSVWRAAKRFRMTNAYIPSQGIVEAEGVVMDSSSAASSSSAAAACLSAQASSASPSSAASTLSDLDYSRSILWGFKDASLQQEYRRFFMRDVSTIVVGMPWLCGNFLYPAIKINPATDTYPLSLTAGVCMAIVLCVDLALHMFYPRRARTPLCRLVMAWAMNLGPYLGSTITISAMYKPCETTDFGIRDWSYRTPERSAMYCWDVVDGYVPGMLLLCSVFIRVPVLQGFAINVLGFVLWECSRYIYGLDALQRKGTIIVHMIVAAGCVLISMVSLMARERLSQTQLVQAVRTARLRYQSERRAKEADTLLCAMVPPSVLSRVMEGVAVRDFTPNATVFFSDMAGFTHWSSQRSAREVLDLLNTLCIELDVMAVAVSVTKIKTIGDAYWAVTGLPDTDAEHAHRMVRFALLFQEAAGRLVTSPQGVSNKWGDVRFRIGIHSGPLQGAVLGTQSLSYEVMGPTSHIAEEVEKAGTAAAVVVSKSTALLLCSTSVSAAEFDVSPTCAVRNYGPQHHHHRDDRGEGIISALSSSPCALVACGALTIPHHGDGSGSSHEAIRLYRVDPLQQPSSSPREGLMMATTTAVAALTTTKGNDGGDDAGPADGRTTHNHHNHSDNNNTHDTSMADPRSGGGGAEGDAVARNKRRAFMMAQRRRAAKKPPVKAIQKEKKEVGDRGRHAFVVVEKKKSASMVVDDDEGAIDDIIDDDDEMTETATSTAEENGEQLELRLQRRRYSSWPILQNFEDNALEADFVGFEADKSYPWRLSLYCAFVLWHIGIFIWPTIEGATYTTAFIALQSVACAAAVALVACARLNSYVQAVLIGVMHITSTYGTWSIPYSVIGNDVAWQSCGSILLLILLTPMSPIVKLALAFGLIVIPTVAAFYQSIYIVGNFVFVVFISFIAIIQSLMLETLSRTQFIQSRTAERYAKDALEREEEQQWLLGCVVPAHIVPELLQWLRTDMRPNASIVHEYPMICVAFVQLMPPPNSTSKLGGAGGGGDDDELAVFPPMPIVTTTDANQPMSGGTPVADDSSHLHHPSAVAGEFGADDAAVLPAPMARVPPPLERPHPSHPLHPDGGVQPSMEAIRAEHAATFDWLLAAQSRLEEALTETNAVLRASAAVAAAAAEVAPSSDQIHRNDDDRARGTAGNDDRCADYSGGADGGGDDGNAAEQQKGANACAAPSSSSPCAQIIKVKTIGDITLLAGSFTGGGTPLEAAEGLLQIVQRLSADACGGGGSGGGGATALHGARIRVGLNVGPVVGSVLGTERLCFDIFGDTVNLTSRAMTAVDHTTRQPLSPSASGGGGGCGGRGVGGGGVCGVNATAAFVDLLRSRKGSAAGPSLAFDASPLSPLSASVSSCPPPSSSFVGPSSSSMAMMNRPNAPLQVHLSLPAAVGAWPQYSIGEGVPFELKGKGSIPLYPIRFVTESPSILSPR